MALPPPKDAADVVAESGIAEVQEDGRLLGSCPRLIAATLRMLRGSKSIIARAWRSEPTQAIGDRRDLFPLPRASAQDLPQGTDSGIDGVTDLVNLCLAGLNCLHTGCRHSAFAPPCQGGPTASQRQVLAHVSLRTAALYQRLADDEAIPSGAAALRRYEPEAAVSPPQLVAENIDLPSVAASCDPIGDVAVELKHVLEWPGDIFPVLQLVSVSIVLREDAARSMPRRSVARLPLASSVSASLR